MIHRRKQYRLRLRRDRLQTALQRAEHPALRVWIHGKHCFRRTLDPRPDRLGVMAYDYDHRIPERAKQQNQAVQKSFTLKAKQRFGRAHTAGSAAGQDNSGDRTWVHFRTAREASVAKIDFAAWRHSESGARRIAIISATTETAISSGVMAPISNPIGAKMRSKTAR